MTTGAPVSDTIFRAYDIRGVVGKTLTPEVVFQIGHAVGSLAFDRGERGVVVGRDGRLSGPHLPAARTRPLGPTVPGARDNLRPPAAR